LLSENENLLEIEIPSPLGYRRPTVREIKRFLDDQTRSFVEVTSDRAREWKPPLEPIPIIPVPHYSITPVPHYLASTA
jgi:hypothetical protein